MAAMQASLDAVVDWMLRASWQAGMLAMIVLALTWMLRRWISPSAGYGLLLLVAARLVMPAMPQSALSVFNLVKSATKSSQPRVEPDALPSGEWVIIKEPLSHPVAQISAGYTSPQARVLTWRFVLEIAWLVGALLIASRIVYANVKLARRIRRGAVIDDPRILDLLDGCKLKMNVHHSVPVIETDAIHSPALMGLFRPRLLMPMDLRHRLSDGELRFVFLHELAHLKRQDIAIDWCLAILQTLHWFNPLIWLAFARARAERELARDAMVLQATQPEEQTGYGQTIVKLVESFARLGPRPGTIGILEGNSGKTQLKRRITMIADFKRPMRGGTILAGLIAAALCIALLTDRKATAADAVKGDKPAGTADPNVVPPGPAPRSVATHDVNARDAAAQAILDHRMPELKLNAVALSDALDFLRDATGGNIVVDWKNLEAAGIAKTAPVTLRLRDVKVSKALNTILSGVGGDVKLDFEIEDGVVFITTAEELEKHTQVNVYDIRDLMMSKDEKVNQESAKELIKLIEETIDPQTWAAKGSHVGSIKYLSGNLIVTQTKANQKQLVSLLDKLRETRGIQVSVVLRLISMPRAIMKDAGVELANDADIEQRVVVGRKGDGKPGKAFQGTFLDDDQVGKLIRKSQASVDSSTLTAPRMTLFNGQQGTIMVGDEMPYIAGWSEPKDGKREPQIAHVKTGFTMNLQAFVSADRKYVTINMQPRLAKLRKIDEVPRQAENGDKVNIQKPDLAVQEVDTIVSIPDNGTLLTVLSDNEEKGKDAKGIVNILLVRPTIVIAGQGERPQIAPLENKPAR